MAAEEDSVARPDALGGGSRAECFEPSLLSASPEIADVWVRREIEIERGGGGGGRCSFVDSFTCRNLLVRVLAVVRPENSCRARRRLRFAWPERSLSVPLRNSVKSVVEVCAHEVVGRR